MVRHVDTQRLQIVNNVGSVIGPAPASRPVVDELQHPAPRCRRLV